MGVLGDDALQSQLAGALKDRRAVAGQMLVERYPACAFHAI
jgi:hypothetical protein